jgi:hypothetical protein
MSAVGFPAVEDDDDILIADDEPLPPAAAAAGSTLFSGIPASGLLLPTPSSSSATGPSLFLSSSTSGGMDLIGELERECRHWQTRYEAEKVQARLAAESLSAQALWVSQAERCLRRCMDAVRDIRSEELTRPLAGRAAIGGHDRDETMTLSMRRIELLSDLIREGAELLPPSYAEGGSDSTIAQHMSPVCATPQRRPVLAGTSGRRSRQATDGSRWSSSRRAEDGEAKLLHLKLSVQQIAQRRAANALSLCVQQMSLARTTLLRRRYFNMWHRATYDRRRMKIVSAQLQKLRRDALVSIAQHRIVFQTFARRYFSHWLMVTNVRRQTRSMRSLVGLFSQQSVMIAAHIRNQHELSVGMVEDCAELLAQQSAVLQELEITSCSNAMKLLETRSVL